MHHSLASRRVFGWLDVGAGYDEVALDVAHGERRHRGSIFADKSSAREIMHKTAAPITMPSMVMLLLRNAEHRSNEVEVARDQGC